MCDIYCKFILITNTANLLLFCYYFSYFPIASNESEALHISQNKASALQNKVDRQAVPLESLF